MISKYRDLKIEIEKKGIPEKYAHISNSGIPGHNQKRTDILPINGMLIDGIL